MIRQLVVFVVFSLLSVKLHAAPVPSPDHTHGSYVSVAPANAANANAHSSTTPHAGVVVGGPNEHNHYQVAVVSHNPPPPHQPLQHIHPTSGMRDAANSHIGTGHPMEFHDSHVNHMHNPPSPLSHHETSRLQSTIQHNTGHATWPAHNAAGGHTLAGAAHAVHAGTSLLHRISTGNDAHHNPPSPGGSSHGHGSHPPSPAGSDHSHASSRHSLAGAAHAVHAGTSLLNRISGHPPAAHGNTHHNAAASSSHSTGHHTLAGAAHAVHAGNSLLHRISGHAPAAHGNAHHNAPASSSHHGPGGHQVGGSHGSSQAAARQGRRPNPMAGNRGGKGGKGRR